MYNSSKVLISRFFNGILSRQNTTYFDGGCPCVYMFLLKTLLANRAGRQAGLGDQEDSAKGSERVPWRASSGKTRPCRNTYISRYGLIIKIELVNKKLQSSVNSFIISVVSLCVYLALKGSFRRDLVGKKLPATIFCLF